MPQDQEKFQAFFLPDITQVDTTKITKFSSTAPEWRIISPGLNLQGKCKNKKCKANKKMVWTALQFGTFHMSETVYKCKCPICGEYTKGNKKIGLYKCTLTGRGLKAKVPKKVVPSEQSPRNSQKATQNSEDTDDSQDENDPSSVQEKEIEFLKIQVTSKDGFLKMDGINGQFVKWRYMTLEINKIQEN